MRLFLALCALLTIAVPASARSHKQPPKPPAPADPGYVYALAAANRFLHAWQAGDLADGMVLLSDGLRHSQQPEKLEDFFLSSTDRSFEISTGHGHHGRYSFPVVLVVLRRTRIARRSSEIILVNTGKNDWVVDKLP